MKKIINRKRFFALQLVVGLALIGLGYLGSRMTGDGTPLLLFSIVGIGVITDPQLLLDVINNI